MIAPSPGTFLRPLGYSYTLEVLEVFPSDKDCGGLPRVLCRRWGLKDGRPFDDGHVLAGHGLSLRHRGPSVWSSPSHYAHDFRFGAILWQVVPGPNGQMGLFS